MKIITRIFAPANERFKKKSRANAPKIIFGINTRFPAGAINFFGKKERFRAISLPFQKGANSIRTLLEGQ